MTLINKIKKSKFLVDFLSTLSSNVSLLVVGLLSSIITTRILGPSGMGIYAILTNFTLIFVSLAELGIRQSTIYYSGKEIYKLDQIFSANVNIWLISSTIGITIFVYIIHSSQIDIKFELLFISALIIPASIANSFINGIMIGADKITKNANYNIYNGFLKLGLVALLVWAFKLYVFGAILAMLIPTITLVFKKYLFLNKTISLRLKINFNLKIIKKLVANGILYGFALFLMTNQKTIPILIMASKLPKSDIGIYSAASVFASLLYTINNALAPIIFLQSSKSKNQQENSAKIQKLMRVLFVILSFLSIVLYFALDFIIPLFYGNRFIESIPITRILLIGVIFYNVFLILNMDLAGRGKPWIAIYALIPVTLINFFSNYYFIDLYGLSGAAFSTSISMVIGAFIYICFYSKETKIQLLEIISPKKSDWYFISNLIGKTVKK